MTPTATRSLWELPSRFQNHSGSVNAGECMEQVWFVAALWLALALAVTLLSIWLRISTALSEIVVGTVAQLAIGALIGAEDLGARSPWDPVSGRHRRNRPHVPCRSGA